ncbi:unnamed protein product [Colias eurytheme]|nr:unnamed protein product [Colias eurytheme]
MHLKGISILFFGIAFLLVNDVNAFPRDSSVIKTEPVFEKQDEISPKVKDPSQESVISYPTFVSCEYNEEEPVEDRVCQEHCLDKGYSYGLCMKSKCSCI